MPSSTLLRGRPRPPPRSRPPTHSRNRDGKFYANYRPPFRENLRPKICSGYFFPARGSDGREMRGRFRVFVHFPEIITFVKR